MSEQRMVHPVCSLVPDATRELEQTSTFWEFPGKFIILALITEWACQNKIINTVCGNVSTSNATQWECMVDMVDVFPFFFLKLSRAVIALMLLPFQQILDLFRRIGTLYGFFTRYAPMRVGTVYRSAFWACSIGSFLILYLLTSIVSSSLFSIFRLAHVDIASTFVPYFSSFSYFCAAFILFAIGIFSFMAFGACSISFLLSFQSLLNFRLRSIGFEVFTIVGSLSVSFVVRTFAFLAYSAHAVFFAFVSAKEFSGSRMPLIFFRTHAASFERTIVIWGLLGYNILHSKNFTFLLSRLWDASTSAGATQYLPSHYTIHQHLKQVQGVFV